MLIFGHAPTTSISNESFNFFQYPTMSRIPFPAKKAFQNTQRSVLEHRMAVLNEFLRVICSHAETIDELFVIMREFVEPDTNDRKISGGTVIRTVRIG